MTNPLADMDKPDVIFAIGTNMTEAHPVAATRLKQGLAKGAKLIVADPRRVKLTELADLYLPLRVGSDAALLLAMAHVIQREGLVDEAFVAERTDHAEEFLEHVKKFTPEWASSITGLPPEDIEKAAIWYASAEKGAIYYTLGITEHISGVDNVMSLSNLALMTGHLGREGTGINPMRGQNNVQGAGDMGCSPNNYPGFQKVTDPANQAKFQEAWGRDISLEIGPTKVTALEEGGEHFHAMLIDGENTIVSDPDVNLIQRSLESLEHLVVIDLFMTETAELADVVLPATAWAETDGTFVNTERRVQRVREAVPPPGQAKPDWWIVAQIAQRLGFPGFDWNHAGEVFDEACSLMPIYNGLSWDRISRGPGLNWPVPSSDHPGTPRLHEDGFPIGRGLFKIIEYRDPAEVVSEAYPIWLTTGRRLQAYHTRTQTGRAAGIDYLLSEETLEVHPDDVLAWGLTDGGYARVTSPRGSIRVKVQASSRSPRGTVFTSFAFSDTPVNVLTGGGYDPVTHTAELKVCPVRVEAE
jgi:predicted molibdopterin-dependent oxidoreductase YjgC